ncbi:MAG: DAK2 domain-containing protein, partial [Nitriliruptoraceae bacterium]
MAAPRAAPLAARELPALFDRVHAALQARRHAIDDLNVFPVPDGDTGTNLTLTVRAGRDALAAARASRPAGGREALAREVIRGAIRGARGNSGVIVSQVVRAVVEVTVGEREVDAALYAAALAHARELAYEAVADPVEGTILTAIATAAEAAGRAAADGADLVTTSAAACAATAIAVERTREQLDVLREAGVVDAGARGFEVLLAAVHGHLTGEEPPVAIDPPRDRVVHTGGHVCHGSLAHPYEVQYLLDASDAVAAPLRVALEQLGESVVVVAAGGLLNVHVHTDRIGPAIEAGLAHGRPSAIEVVHLGEQVAAQDATRTLAAAARAVEVQAAAIPRPDRPLGAVAVLHGLGAVALARSLGAEVVDGTAGALPS